MKPARYAKAMPIQRAESPIYQAYLMRLWRDNPNAPWRVTLQSTATEELRHFATLDALWTFLQPRLAVEQDDSSLPPAGEQAENENSPRKEA